MTIDRAWPFPARVAREDAGLFGGHILKKFPDRPNFTMDSTAKYRWSSRLMPIAENPLKIPTPAIRVMR